MAAMGMSFASSNFVGNQIGAGNPRSAKLYAWASFYISLLIAFVIAASFYFFRFQIGRIFTDHEELISLIADILPIIAIESIGDVMEESLSGTIRAIGIQTAATYLIFITTWVFGFPCCYILCFVFEYGQKGLWISNTLIRWTISTGYTIMMLRTDWEKVCHESAERMKKDKADLAKDE